MTNLIIHPEVEEELNQAWAYYNDIDPELAVRMLDEVYERMALAQESPLHFNTFYKQFRRILCKTFPYKIIFEVVEEKQAVHIVAVRHQEEHQDAWKERL